MTMKYYYLIFAAVLFIVSFSCKSPSGPDVGETEPDTTSQNFSFETYEFGDGFESSYLNDVWIFDKNNIWAVGYVNVTNTTGRTNILRWIGDKWIGFGPQFNSAGIYGIWAADSQKIFFAVGAVIKYEKGKFKEMELGDLGFTNNQGVHKLWGSSNSNVWGVGPWGTIVHYDGSEWSKVDFDQQWYFYGIAGDPKSGVAYAVASNQQFNTVIVSLQNNSAKIIYNSQDDQNQLTSYSIKLLNSDELLLGFTKVWKFNIKEKTTKILYTPSSGDAVVAMAINHSKDIYYFFDKYGPGEMLLHYNGNRYIEIDYSNRSNVIYGGAFAIKDLAVITGFSNNKAYLVEVKRR